MKKVLLSLACLLAGAASFAKAVSSRAAALAARNFLAQKGHPEALTNTYTGHATANGESRNAFYVFSGVASYVVISADDRVPPVLGFSEEGAFPAGDVPPLHYWLSRYAQQIGDLLEEESPAAPEVAELWQSLQSAQRSAQAKPAAVNPMLASVWGQGEYYNALCPGDGANHALVGCVATAMAQVMRFWGWPLQGVGQHTYYAPAYGTQEVHFDASTYNWSAMPDQVSTPNADVARICYDAGVSVNMNYGMDGSGANMATGESAILNCTEYAMKTYFSYDTTLHGVARLDYSDADWLSLIKAELDAGRPVMYTGRNNVEGHCFIADGYKDGGYVHFNWGWYGAGNGYFALDNLNPADDYNDAQWVLVGVKPAVQASAIPTLQDGTPALRIFPNPAGQEVFVDAARLQGNVYLEVLDMQGRSLIQRSGAGGALVHMALGQLATGTYILRWRSADTNGTQSFVVGQ